MLHLWTAYDILLLELSLLLQQGFVFDLMATWEHCINTGLRQTLACVIVTSFFLLANSLSLG